MKITGQAISGFGRSEFGSGLGGRMSKIVYLRPPITVKELAAQLEILPFRVIYDLCGMNVFINGINESIETEVAKFIFEQYGYTLFTGE
jgi:hypothetical protein